MPSVQSSVDDFLSRDSFHLADTVLSCPYCGRDHKVPYQQILVQPGAISQVSEIARKALGRYPSQVGVIYDRAIEGIIEHEFLTTFQHSGMPIIPLPLGKSGEWLDSSRELGDEAAQRVPPQVDLLIAAGSGVICDLTKWIATCTHKPFILCGSAPSMNGYTSITAVITEHDMKLTKYVDIPYAVVMDSSIMSCAPAKMIQAGVGDLAARAICNADWRLSNFLHDSYFCPLPYQMTAKPERSYLAACEQISQAQLPAINQLSEAIAISGLSMSILDGETSPSSGGEHVISHFWDLMNHLEDAPRNLHGAQVGIGTLIMMAAYDFLRRINPAHLNAPRLLSKRLNLAQIQQMNTARFGSAAALMNETSKNKYLPDSQYRSLIQRVIHHWEEMWAAVSPYQSISLENLRNRFIAAGVPVTLTAIQRTRQQAIDALLFGSRYRPRYTLLDLLWDLGLFPDAAGDILDIAGVLGE